MSSCITSSENQSRAGAPAAPWSRRRLAALLATATLTLALAAMFNALVDPDGAYPGVDLAALRPYESERGTRTAKAADLLRGGYPTVFFGTSRTEIGFDPRHRAVKDRPGYNAALGGTNMWELARVYAFAAEHNDLKTVVLAMDFLLFTDKATSNNDFEASLFNPDRAALVYHLDNLLSQRALAASVGSLKILFSGRKQQYDDSGFRVQGKVEIRRSTLEICAARVREYATGFGDYRFSEERFASLASIVDARSRAGLRTVILIPPVHSLLLETIREAGLWDVFESFKRRLAALARPAGPGAAAVVVFDFTGYNIYTTDPIPLEEPRREMRWYWEISHFRRELGDIVLDRALGGADPPLKARGSSFGARINAANIDEHLALIRRERARWAASATDELAWFARTLGIAGVDPAPSD